MAERAPQIVLGTRVCARREALDGAAWPAGALVLRLAEDDALVLGPGSVSLDDPDAVVVEEAGFAGLWLDDLAALAAVCAWPLPERRPALAQGAVAGLPARVWLEAERALLLVPAAYAEDLAERLR